MGIMVKQLLNGSRYILELKVPGELEYQLTGKTTVPKRIRLSKFVLTEEEKEAYRMFRAFYNKLHRVDDVFISTITKSDSSGNTATFKVIIGKDPFVHFY